MKKDMTFEMHVNTGKRLYAISVELEKIICELDGVSRGKDRKPMDEISRASNHVFMARHKLDERFGRELRDKFDNMVYCPGGVCDKPLDNRP